MCTSLAYTANGSKQKQPTGAEPARSHSPHSQLIVFSLSALPLTTSSSLRLAEQEHLEAQIESKKVRFQSICETANLHNQMRGI